MDLDCSPAALALALVLASGLRFARCLTLASVGQLRISLSPTLPAPSAQLGLWWPIVGSKVEQRLCDLPLQKLRGSSIENEEDLRKGPASMQLPTDCRPCWLIPASRQVVPYDPSLHPCCCPALPRKYELRSTSPDPVLAVHQSLHTVPSRS